MADVGTTRSRYLMVWNGELGLSTLDDLLTPGYLGHMGSRERGIERLKEDIAAYRSAAPAVRFSIEHEFADNDYVASRVRALGTDSEGRRVGANGLNISRFENGLLAEEWAAWEALAPLD